MSKYIRIILIFIFVIQLSAQDNFHHSFLEKEYDGNQFCKILPLSKMKHKDVVSMLEELQRQFPKSFNYEQIGESIEKRSIHLVKLGKGKTKILLWSQMHGDEPTATAALFDVFNFLLKNSQTKFAKDILDNVTILAVPMLNPDGAEVFKRRNAQDIDVNRDARDLQSPEGRILFSLKAKYKPEFGFNLHDQDGRRTVGKSNQLAGIALMAPPFDSSDNDNAVRIRAKKVVTVICQSLGPYLYGHVSKYDAEYMPRAFGDSMQNWGVSTILVESGGWYENRDAFLQKMNFIALLASFHAIGTGSYKEANPAYYDILPENDKNIFDLIIRDIMVFDGTGTAPFKADIGINFNSKNEGKIVDFGDLNFFAAKDTIEGNGLYLAPGFIRAAPGPLDDKKLKELLSNGFTTLLISQEKSAAFKKDQPEVQKNTAPNIKKILFLDQRPVSQQDTLKILKTLSEGLSGILDKSGSLKDSSFIKYSGKPVILLSTLNTAEKCTELSGKCIKGLTSEQAEKWNIKNRGKIRIGQQADLVILSKDEKGSPVVELVLVKGNIVWKKNEE